MRWVRLPSRHKGDGVLIGFVEVVEKGRALLMVCHTDVVGEGRKNSEANTGEAFCWTGLGQANHDEAWFKLAGHIADEVDYRCRVL